jgi:hypothetical protein
MHKKKIFFEPSKIRDQKKHLVDFSNVSFNSLNGDFNVGNFIV